MSGYKLQPMPEIFLVDPVTGELPRNYKKLLSERKRKDVVNVNVDLKQKIPKYNLQPMRELALIDPNTGELPKNYKEILAQQAKEMHNDNIMVNNKSEQDTKKVCSVTKFKSQRMPELSLVDRITGKLPRNYKEILAEKKAEVNNKPEQDTKEACSESKFKLQPMPELFLLDPTTGNLPKNYEDILKDRKTKGLPINTYWKDQSKDTKGKVEITKNITSNLFGQDNTRNKSVRKVLFQNVRKARPGGMKTRPSQVIKERSDDTIPLLDLEECAEQLHVIKEKPKAARKILPTPKLTPARIRRRSTGKSSSKSSNSSMEEFLKYEQQCKTPKSIIKRKRQRRSDHLKHDFAKTVDEIKALCKEIEESKRKNREEQKKIDDNLNKIVSRLKLIEGMIPKNIEFSSIDNKENIELSQHNKSSPNPIGNDTTLRITTLKKNLGRKVLFELNENEKTEFPIKNSKTELKIFGTPTTMVRVSKDIADNQYLQLQDTPKLK